MIDIRNPKQYCEHFLKIRDKKGNIIPLRLKPAQEMLYQIIKEEHDAGRPVRLIILKGRQLGTSTEVEGLFFADAATRANVFTLIVAHVEDATTNLFNMNKLFYDNLPPEIKPMLKASNAQELVFENPTKDPVEKKRNPGLRSRIRCVTAGSRGVGRSFTLRNVHCSESAFWPNMTENMLGILQAVPDDKDTCVVMESTANGYNEFKTFWDGAVSGENAFRPVFLAWYLDPDYRRPVPPGTEWTEDEEQMRADYGLDDEQLQWRRWCIKANCGGDVQKFRQEYPSNPQEAFLFTGRPFFDNESLERLRERAQEPKHIGYFTYTEAADGKPESVEWREDKNGYVRIWQEPEDGHPYVAGCDTAGDGSDRFTAFLIDNADGRQCAELQKDLSEPAYARQLYCLGRYYNNALLAVEINFSTYVELKLEEWAYPNLYRRKRFDKKAAKLMDANGWRTDKSTRPVALANLWSVMDEVPELVRSKWTLGEMMVFARNEHDRPEAMAGEHDDLVMAAAICHMAREQGRQTVDERPEEKREKLIVQLEHRKRRKML